MPEPARTARCLRDDLCNCEHLFGNVQQKGGAFNSRTQESYSGKSGRRTLVVWKPHIFGSKGHILHNICDMLDKMDILCHAVIRICGEM